VFGIFNKSFESRTLLTHFANYFCWEGKVL
jgi:hypothetical protein